MPDVLESLTYARWELDQLEALIAERRSLGLTVEGLQETYERISIQVETVGALAQTMADLLSDLEMD